MGPKAAHVVVFNREKGLLEEEKIHPVPPPPPLPPSLVCQPQGAGPAPLRRRGVERGERGGRGGRGGLCGGLVNGPRSGSVSKALVPRCRGPQVKSV